MRQCYSFCFSSIILHIYRHIFCASVFFRYSLSYSVNTLEAKYRGQGHGQCRDQRRAPIYSSFTHTMVMYLTDKLKGQGAYGIKFNLNCILHDFLWTDLFLYLEVFWERLGVVVGGADKVDDGCKQSQMGRVCQTRPHQSYINT